MYCAIIGDIVESKKITKREEIQNKLAKKLTQINKEIPNIASNFSITLGDEFQGLLQSCDHVIKIVNAVKLEMYPIKIRFGVGLGEMSTSINKELPLGSDGKAYHNARSAIDEIKKIEKQYEPPAINVMVKIQNEILLSDRKNIDVNLLNINFSACSFIEKSWTLKQIEVLKLKEKNLTQRQIAEKLNITQSNVQRRIDASGYYTYNYCLNNIQIYLKELWETMNVY